MVVRIKDIVTVFLALVDFTRDNVGAYSLGKGRSDD